MTYGSKYDSALDITTIAKLVRKDIKAAIPWVKTSVRTKRYSGGKSLNVTITELGYQIHSNEFLRAFITNPNVCFRGGRFSTEANEAKTTIERIVNAYNKNHSSDPYCHSNYNFYGSVSFNTTHGNTEFDAMQETIATETAAPKTDSYGDALETFISNL